MICKDVIKRLEKENNEVEYVVKYDKQKEFNELTDQDIDFLFKYVVDDYLSQKNPKLNIGKYSKNEIDHLVIKVFFEGFFDEFESTKNNINEIKKINDDYQKLLKNNET